MKDAKGRCFTGTPRRLGSRESTGLLLEHPRGDRSVHPTAQGGPPRRMFLHAVTDVGVTFVD